MRVRAVSSAVVISVKGFWTPDVRIDSKWMVFRLDRLRSGRRYVFAIGERLLGIDRAFVEGTSHVGQSPPANANGIEHADHRRYRRALHRIIGSTGRDGDDRPKRQRRVYRLRTDEISALTPGSDSRDRQVRASRSALERPA